MVMLRNETVAHIETILVSQCNVRTIPPAGYLEQRVLELECMGLEDFEEMPGVPSSLRQFAIATLQHNKPAYFITGDEELLFMRDELEGRYGLMVLSIQEAMLLLRDLHEPPD